MDDFIGFLDTGGGMTFQFRNPELNSKVKIIYREEPELANLPKKVIVFFQRLITKWTYIFINKRT